MATSSASKARSSGFSSGPRRSDSRIIATPSTLVLKTREATIGRERTGKLAGFDALLDVFEQVLLHLPGEREALVVPRNLRHRAIHEHQGEVLGVLAAEPVEAAKNGTDAIEWRHGFGVRGDAVVNAAQQPETLFGEREEDVVLRWEVAVDRGRAVLDPVGDLPDGDVLVALGDEQVARRIENGSADGFPVSFLTFFDAHVEQCSDS